MEPIGHIAQPDPITEPRKRNVALIIVVIMLVFSALLNIVFFMALISLALVSVDDGSGLYARTVDGEPGALEKILMIRVEGVITGQGYAPREPDIVEYIRCRLKLAQEEDYAGVLLAVNSPGGGVSESDEIYNLIKGFRADSGKPVVAYFKNVAASGGYYISAGCDRIIAQPTTITGSIGVIMSLLQVDGLMSKAGVKSNIIVSDKTPHKDIASPFREMSAEERALLKNIVEEMYTRFVDVVTEGRSPLAREQVENLATGMIYTGTDALKHKLVDEVGYFKEAAAAVRKAAGTPNALIEELESPVGLLGAMLGAEKELTVKVVTLEDLPRIYHGLPMYVWMPGAKK